MKYILGLLIIIGIIAVILGLCTLIAFGINKLVEFENRLDYSYGKYHRFKNVMNDKIGPWILASGIIIVILICLVTFYLDIVKVI